MGVEGGNKESLRCKEAGETAAAPPPAPPQRTTQSSNIPPPSIYNNLETDDASGSHPRGTSFTSCPTIPESFMVFTPQSSKSLCSSPGCGHGASPLASIFHVSIKAKGHHQVGKSDLVFLQILDQTGKGQEKHFQQLKRFSPFLLDYRHQSGSWWGSWIRFWFPLELLWFCSCVSQQET